MWAACVGVLCWIDLYAALGVHKDGAICSQIGHDNAFVVVHSVTRLVNGKEGWDYLMGSPFAKEKRAGAPHA
jgi:hypothetical protein